MGRAMRDECFQDGSRSIVGGHGRGGSRGRRGKGVRSRWVECLPPRGQDRDRKMGGGGCKLQAKRARASSFSGIYGIRENTGARESRVSGV